MRDRGARAILVGADELVDRADAGLEESEEESGFDCIPLLKLETWALLPKVDTGGKRAILDAGRVGTPVDLSTFLIVDRSGTA